MNIFFTHALFFVVGVLQDLLITSYYQAIAKHLPLRSGAFSFVVTIVNLLVLYGILAGLEDQVITVIIVYALGNAVGTYAVVIRGKR